MSPLEQGARDELPAPDATCDGGELDCGSGLLLIIRKAMEPLTAGGVLEVQSRESSVREDLPAWCRMVGHALLGVREGAGPDRSYFLRKRAEDPALAKDLEQARQHSWRARVRWKGGMQARVAVRNHDFAVGQPASFDTADAAPSAIEYLLGAAGAALAVGFSWRLSRAGIEPRELEVVVQGRSANILSYLGLEEGEHPGLADLSATLYLDCDAEQAVLERILAETIARCPVTQSLARSTPLEARLRTV